MITALAVVVILALARSVADGRTGGATGQPINLQNKAVHALPGFNSISACLGILPQILQQSVTELQIKGSGWSLQSLANGLYPPFCSLIHRRFDEITYVNAPQDKQSYFAVAIGEYRNKKIERQDYFKFWKSKESICRLVPQATQNVSKTIFSNIPSQLDDSPDTNYTETCDRHVSSSSQSTLEKSSSKEINIMRANFWRIMGYCASKNFFEASGNARVDRWISSFAGCMMSFGASESVTTQISLLLHPFRNVNYCFITSALSKQLAFITHQGGEDSFISNFVACMMSSGASELIAKLERIDLIGEYVGRVIQIGEGWIGQDSLSFLKGAGYFSIMALWNGAVSKVFERSDGPMGGTSRDDGPARLNIFSKKEESAIVIKLGGSNKEMVRLGPHSLSLPRLQTLQPLQDSLAVRAIEPLIQNPFPQRQENPGDVDCSPGGVKRRSTFTNLPTDVQTMSMGGSQK